MPWLILPVAELEHLFCSEFNGSVATLLMEEPPEEKRLETASFIIHATRGVIRDQRTRRKAMVILLALAVLMLVAGFTVFQSSMNPREHPWFVILFWIVCVWLTFTAMLLAVFDLLMVRLEARRAARALQEGLEAKSPSK